MVPRNSGLEVAFIERFAVSRRDLARVTITALVLLKHSVVALVRRWFGFIEASLPILGSNGLVPAAIPVSSMIDCYILCFPWPFFTFSCLHTGMGSITFELL